MLLESELIKGTLIKRYKRFLADVKLENGENVTAHCPNTGSMKGYKEEGLRVWLSKNNNPKRKLKYTWEMVEDSSGEKIFVYAAKANTLVKEAIDEGTIEELLDYDNIRTEVKYGRQNSRIDLLLEKDNEKCYVEVKSVTMKVGDILMFPDAVSTRGQKHLEELMEVKEQGDRAVLFFAVLREGGKGFFPAKEIDSVYAQLLHTARDKGVEVLIYQVAFKGLEISLEKKIDFI
ncbi:DNA/RNA nuclease SfsA [Sulfurimonas sp. MAG313]|nr:DNA/RNA nuclease SfsA [Sulfurimonas sp. MAG313]